MNFTKIQTELDYYKKFKPINYTMERIKFFEQVEKNEPYNPKFNYPDKLRVSDYKDLKICLKKEMGKDGLVDEFLKIYLVVVDILIAWRKNSSEVLSNLSGKIFGSTALFDLEQTIKEYKKLDISAHSAAEVYSHQQIGKRFLEEFAKRKLEGWSIVYDETSGGNVSIYESQKKIVIKNGATATAAGLECAVTHELDGHAIQAFNAMSHKRHRSWLLSYLGTEKQYEGYATFVVVNNLSVPHILSELKHNFALIIATSLAQRLSFYETYQKMYDLCKDKNFSFSAAYKAKRGFHDTGQPGCFQKEISYLLGALEIIKLVEENKENYYKLAQGCFPLSAIKFIAGKKPRWESIKKFNQKNWQYFKNKLKPIIKRNPANPHYWRRYV